MIQNIMALAIVLSATGYTVFSIIKNLTAKKASKCSGCAGCSFIKECNSQDHFETPSFF
jgi:hypothetical protein